jgi:hypothetical protein
MTVMIIDLPKLYCPMGCGNTLHVMVGEGYGGLTCLARNCPDKDAAQKILSDGEHLDIVEFGDAGWRVLHPLRERLGDGLFACRVHAAVAALDENPPDGRYRAMISEDGELVLKKIPA